MTSIRVTINFLKTGIGIPLYNVVEIQFAVIFQLTFCCSCFPLAAMAFFASSYLVFEKRKSINDVHDTVFYTLLSTTGTCYVKRTITTLPMVFTRNYRKQVQQETEKLKKEVIKEVQSYKASLNG